MASILKGQSGQPIQFETKPNVNGDDVLTRPEIVGTVSESGGVPTGAIIERGSNANGEYVKYADGTMICRGQSITSTQLTSQYGPLYGTLDHTVNLPVNFVGNFSFVPFRKGVLGGAWIATGSGTHTANRTSVRALWHGSVADTVPFDWSAIGRWY